MQIKQKNFYKLRNEMDYSAFLRVIGLAHDRNFDVIIRTDLDNERNLEMTHESVDLIEKYHEVLSENDIYKTIGFITLESLKIEKIRIETKNDIIVFHPSVVYYQGELENLKKLIGQLGLSPDYWLSEK